MTRPADHACTGFAHLRHHTRLPPARRNVIGGARVLDDGPQLELVEPGDAVNWAFWACAPALTLSDPDVHTDPEPRSLGAWAMAWAVRTRDGRLLPRYDDRHLDGRFRAMRLRSSADPPASTGDPSDPSDPPRDVAPVHGRQVPDGVDGVMLAATREDAQTNLFVPLLELVAHHRGDSPPRLSSPVFDITPGSRAIDRSRAAGLHAHLRVTQLPEGSLLGLSGAYVPAWNLARSAGDATGYGAFLGAMSASDRHASTGGQAGAMRTTGSRSETSGIGAFAGHAAFGPLHPGGLADKHQVGRSADAIAWNSGHIWTRALFYDDASRDGPLLFERVPFRRGGSLPVPVRVHLTWDESLPHAWLDGTRPGHWRWYTTSPIRKPKPPDDAVPPLLPPPPGEPPTDGPPITPGQGPVPPRVPAPPPGRLNPGPGETIDPARTPYELALPSIYGTPVRRSAGGGETGDQPYDGRFGGAPVDEGIDPDDLASGLFPDTPRDTTPRPDGDRRTAPPAPAGPAGAAWTRAPLVWHLQSWGASDDAGDWKATLDAGDYYLSATTHGGALFGPPEVLLDGEAPAAASDVAFALYNGLHDGAAVGNPARFGFVTPDPATGGVSDGWYVTASGASDAVDAVMRFVDSAGSSRTGALTVEGSVRLDACLGADCVNIGTTTDASGTGDLSAGLTGSNSRLSYDASAGALELTDTSGTRQFRSDGATAMDINGGCKVASGSAYCVGSDAVVGGRITGWGTPTGTTSRSTFDTGTPTLTEVAQRLAALINDLTTHGLIGN